MLAAAWMTAGATVLLAAFAVVTAWYARKAFREQSQELSALQRQAEGTAMMIEIQSGQLDAQRQQLEAQKQVSERQATVLDLQAEDLKVSIAERERAAEGLRRAQASRVFLWTEAVPAAKPDPQSAAQQIFGPPGPGKTYVRVRNTSDQPVYDLQFRWRIGESPLPPFTEPLAMVFPGSSKYQARPVHPSADALDFGADITFRDAAGLKWIRRINGELDEWQP
jgi:hypothetical protein